MSDLGRQANAKRMWARGLSVPGARVYRQTITFSRRAGTLWVSVESEADRTVVLERPATAADRATFSSTVTSGAITAPSVTSSASDLTLTAPATFDLDLAGSATVGFSVLANGTNDNHSRRLVNVTDPTSDQDAATKAYVDDVSFVTTVSVDVSVLNAGACRDDAITGLSVSVPANYDCVSVYSSTTAGGLIFEPLSLVTTNGTVRFCANNGEGISLDPASAVYKFRCFRP